MLTFSTQNTLRLELKPSHPTFACSTIYYLLSTYFSLVPDPSSLNIGARESDSPESEHLRSVTYEIIRKICKTNPISEKSSLHNALYYRDLRKLDTWSNRKNEPKTNPIQSQFKPNLCHRYQTQFKANLCHRYQTQFRSRRLTRAIRAYAEVSYFRFYILALVGPKIQVENIAAFMPGRGTVYVILEPSKSKI